MNHHLEIISKAHQKDHSSRDSPRYHISNSSINHNKLRLYIINNLKMYINVRKYTITTRHPSSI